MGRTNVNILICGGRDFTDELLFRKILYPYRNKYPQPIKIICGYDPEQQYPPGADYLAHEYAEHWGIAADYYPYHYHLGKAGGSSRNQQMLDEGKPDLVIAFPTKNSKGTWDMVRRAKKAGVETIIVES
jgi:hypothetical protein